MNKHAFMQTKQAYSLHSNGELVTQMFSFGKDGTDNLVSFRISKLRTSGYKLSVLLRHSNGSTRTINKVYQHKLQYDHHVYLWLEGRALFLIH